MRTGFILLTLTLTVPAFPGFAGDASGFDPAAIDQCIAEDQGVCTKAGMQACIDYAQEKYTGDDPDFAEKNCLDASHQVWEAKLTDAYDTLLELEGKAGIKPQEMLRQTETAWIGFRDNLCNYAMEAASAREGSGEIAKLKCQRDEAARHWDLLATRLKTVRK